MTIIAGLDLLPENLPEVGDIIWTVNAYSHGLLLRHHAITQIHAKGHGAYSFEVAESILDNPKILIDILGQLHRPSRSELEHLTRLLSR